MCGPAKKLLLGEIITFNMFSGKFQKVKNYKLIIQLKSLERGNGINENIMKKIKIRTEVNELEKEKYQQRWTEATQLVCEKNQ